jgi:hypothetical protein
MAGEPRLVVNGASPVAVAGALAAAAVVVQQPFLSTVVRVLEWWCAQKL